MALKKENGHMLGVAEVDLWAIHSRGKSVLEATQRSLDVAPDVLEVLRSVLRDNGNMSSVTVMLVLELARR